MNLLVKPKLFKDLWRFIFVWATLCWIRYLWFMPLFLYMNKTSYFQNKSGKYISPVQLGGMAYLDQTYSNLWSDQTTSSKTHHTLTFQPSNVLRHCFQRLKWLFSMLTQSLSCEFYCHSIMGFMPLAIATSSHQTQVCLGDQLECVPSLASILHSWTVCSISQVFNFQLSSFHLSSLQPVYQIWSVQPPALTFTTWWGAACTSGMSYSTLLLVWHQFIRSPWESHVTPPCLSFPSC